jgi:cytosine/adenosine deaminase-related metal-dependent hydrolase
MGLRDQNRLVYGDDIEFTTQVAPNLRPLLRNYFAQFSLPLSEQAKVFHELRSRYHGHGLTAVQLAPTNLHWLSDQALNMASELSSTTGSLMHMHVVETPYQVEYARRRTGGTAVDYIAKFGLLSPALTIGHGVWMSDSDIDVCAAAGVRVCHNCTSNFRLASGRAPITKMAAAGIEIAIGIDEAGLNDDHDMLQEIRLVNITNRTPRIGAPDLGAATVLRMATENGARTTSFADSIGRLEVNRSADLVVWTGNA